MTVGVARVIDTSMVIDADGHTTYTTTWEVTVTDPLDTCNDVSVASGIHLFGDPYTHGSGGNPDAFCCGKSVSNIHQGSSNLFRVVTATFSTKPGTRARSGNNLVANPLNEPWKFSNSFVLGTRVTSRDKDGFPIYTTGLEEKYFDTPDGYIAIQLEGPSLTMSLDQQSNAVAHCNSATIWNLTERKVYLAQWQSQELKHGNLSYFYHNMEFWVKRDKWNEFWHNAGTQEYVSTNPIGQRIVPILSTNDSGGRQTRFLDANGRILPEVSIPGGVITKESELIPEFDFTALSGSIGLPNPLPGNFV